MDLRAPLRSASRIVRVLNLNHSASARWEKMEGQDSGGTAAQCGLSLLSAADLGIIPSDIDPRGLCSWCPTSTAWKTDGVGLALADFILHT
jgi:hypothetical protein